MSATRRILCVGSRILRGDDAGPKVHDRLARTGVPAGVDLVDGGLAGLDLLPLVEGAERIVFVDSVRGCGASGEVVVLGQDVLLGEGSAPVSYGHGDGLAFLLAALPAACEGPVPRIFLVGVEGEAGEGAIEAAARTALDLARADPPQDPAAPAGGRGAARSTC